MSGGRQDTVSGASALVARARRILARPGAWLGEIAHGRYGLRLTADRRTRPILMLEEAAFRALVEVPGLRARPGGGWTARRVEAASTAAPPAAPGRIVGERTVMATDGRLLTFRANLTESPIAWLARRKDAEGRPWLSPAELAAALRLRADAELARSGPSLTMRWDALPRARGGSAARMEPGDRVLAAGGRVARALEACGPRWRTFVEQACIHDTALQAAERALGVPRREGKWLLKAGLQALAKHYGIG
ncbi:hypothetical protein MMB232_01213 [Brevundimonas subvibrioides]|uniref:DUF6456 domain-containing protein n=1 Tax=Brevundimonas subvibrioides TaxID=74313 RepID=UPI0032D5A1FF